MLAPYTVAAIVRALRHVHGDDIARAMLTNGTTLAALIDALLHSPLTNRDAVKLMTQALRSKDFIVTPDFGSVWHIKYVYDRPKSLNVVDLAVITLDHGIFASTDIRLLLAIDRVVKQRGMDNVGANVRSWGQTRPSHRGGGNVTRFFDAETGTEIDPVTIDRTTGAPVGTRPIRIAGV